MKIIIRLSWVGKFSIRSFKRKWKKMTEGITVKVSDTTMLNEEQLPTKKNESAPK